MSMKSQLEKFEARQAKMNADSRAVHEAELKKKQDMINSIEEIKSSDLQGAGGIKEAAAVFTQAGLEFFGSSFGNSVDRIIREVVPSIVRSVVQEEIKNFMDGMLTGVQRQLESEVNQIAKLMTQDTLKVAQSAPTSVTEAPLADIDKPIDGAVRVKRKYGVIKDETVLIANLLKSSNSPIKMSEIVEQLPEISFSSTVPTNKMIRAMAHDPNIVKAGYGFYTYKKSE